MPYSPEALDVFEKKGYLNANRSVNQRQIAEDLAKILLENHVLTDLDDLSPLATLDALTVAVFGTNEPPELRFVVAQLLQAKHNGPVQRKLDNGWVIVSHPVERIIEHEGGLPVTRKFAGRAVANQAQVVEQLKFRPMVDDSERWAKRFREEIDAVVKRIPELEPAARAMIGEATGKVTGQLNAASQA